MVEANRGASMRTILVLNSKAGGSKSTVTTYSAVFHALWDHAVAMIAAPAAMRSRKLPFIGLLRNIQNYGRADGRKLGIAEISPFAAARDLTLWRPLRHCLNTQYALPG